MVSLTPESYETESDVVTKSRFHAESRLRNWERLLRRFLRSKQAVIGAIIVTVLVISAVGAPFFAPKDPIAIDLRNDLKEPSSSAYLGTDELGRDVLSRILYGGQVSLRVAFIAVGISASAGILIGLISGFLSGKVDVIIMRLMDALMAFPPMLLAITIMAALGTGLSNVMVAIGVVRIPEFARLARSQALSMRELEFIEAARVSGSSTTKIIFRHLLPNSMAPIIILAATSTAQAILTEAALSFLGLGAAPPTATWGGMLRTGYSYVRESIWLSIFPGLAIAITTLGFIFLGDGLRDVLDPRMRSRK